MKEPEYILEFLNKTRDDLTSGKLSESPFLIDRVSGLRESYQSKVPIGFLIPELQASKKFKAQSESRSILIGVGEKNLHQVKLQQALDRAYRATGDEKFKLISIFESIDGIEALNNFFNESLETLILLEQSILNKELFEERYLTQNSWIQNYVKFNFNDFRNLFLLFYLEVLKDLRKIHSTTIFNYIDFGEDITTIEVLSVVIKSLVEGIAPNQIPSSSFFFDFINKENDKGNNPEKLKNAINHTKRKLLNSPYDKIMFDPKRRRLTLVQETIKFENISRTLTYKQIAYCINQSKPPEKPLNTRGNTKALFLPLISDFEDALLKATSGPSIY